jgi:integrative and conjugative element protein (TIGR02256 family)
VSQRLLTEADRAFPGETGGVLMGYWAEADNEVVITNAIGPGPKAAHYKKSFIPDSEYQESEIARIYRDSNRLLTYLGDWHTHPSGSSSLSFRDKRTLYRIVTCPDARCPVPLMAVMGGGEDEWLLRVWRYQRRKGPRWLSGIGVVDLLPRLYYDNRL